MLKVYNTLSGKKEEFTPQDPNNVKMYVCGITPYDECHVGHARCYVVFDVIRRYLEYRGYKVRYVQNFTDIDDKIINKAKESLPDRVPSGQADKLTSEQVAAGPVGLRDRAKEIAERYIADYFTQMDALNIGRADEYPRVTEHIPEIVETVKALVDKGLAYVIDGDVYFEIGKFKNYGKLSHRAPEELMPGARVEVDERKKNPLDFALWKGAKPDEPSWDSPWGKGRPGWHIECSVMSMGHLDSPTLDIHGGGQDLIFPHHENEIAQSEACTGKPFARYWMHNGFVTTVGKEKMSKSLGNFFTIRKVLEKYDPMVVRLFLLSAHYRQPMDFSDKELDAAKEGLQRLRTFADKLNFIFEKTNRAGVSEIQNERLLVLREKFNQAMDDDFNAQKALGYVHELVSDINIVINKVLHGKEHNEKTSVLLREAEVLYRKFLEVLGLKIETKIIAREFDSLLVKREDARKNKDWATADRIRKELQGKGITIEDTPFGPRLIVR